MKGCLRGTVGLVFIVLLITWAIVKYNEPAPRKVASGESASKFTPPSPPSPPVIAPTLVSPAPIATPKPVPVTPENPLDTHLPATPATPTLPTEKPYVDRLNVDMQEATASAVTARSVYSRELGVVMTKLKIDPAYQASAATASSLEADVKRLRDKGPQSELASTSLQWMNAKNAVAKLQLQAMDTAPMREATASVSKAQNAVRVAQVRLNDRLKAKLAAADAESKLAAADEQARLERDPIYIAIKSNRLIEGMTESQARESIGSPYSITRSRNVAIMSWNRGAGYYWSATFVDGVITVVSQMVF